jgi:hypothetical protein
LLIISKCHDHFQVKLFFYHKSNDEYRKVITMPETELCQTIANVKNGEEKNNLIKDLVEIVDMAAPGLFHECPYEGVISTFNVTPPDHSALIHFLPTGSFKVVVM